MFAETVKKDESLPLTQAANRIFGDYLRDVIKENHIKPERAEANTKSLAGYWAMPFSKSAEKSTKIVKMASILRAMRSIVSVVDPMHKLNVRFSEESETSAWDAGKNVLLPVSPVDNIDNLEECINVMGGFTIHEAFHSQETRKLLDKAGRAYLKANKWNMWIANLLEDERIEKVGLADTPGYVDYLNYTKEYMWSSKGLPTKWPYSAPKRFYVSIPLIRYEDRIDEILTDDSFIMPRQWLRKWSSDYLADQEKDLTSQKLIDYIEMGKKFFGIDESVEMPEEETMLICGLGSLAKGINSGLQDEIMAALDDEIESASKGTKAYNKIFGGMTSDEYDSRMASVVVRRLSPAGKFIPSRSDLVEKAKATLMLRKNIEQYDTRAQASGVLDEDELYRLFAGDVKIFKDATVASLSSAAVYLLVDMSGSMGRSTDEDDPAYYATGLAQIFVQALASHPQVRVKVLGHTGCNDHNGKGGSFYRIWEPGDPISRLSILQENSLYCENYDGYAIAWAGTMLQKESAEQKIMIVLADGAPSAPEYGGLAAVRHVRTVTDSLGRKGIKVIQVALSSYLNERKQAEMFKNYIAVDTSESDVFASVLKKLTKLLRKVV